MPTVAELNVVITAQDQASARLQALGHDVQRVEREVESASGAFGRLGGVVSRLGQIGLAAGGLGAIVDSFRGAVGAVGGLVEQASDLNEQLSRSGAIFGEASASVQAFAATTAQSLGISRTEALEAAGSFGTLFRTAGLSTDAAAEMSTKLVTLAADLASFNNIDPSEALEKLRSGLVGESEPLRSVGVLLSEDAVKQEALRLGLARTAGELTEANRVQARYSLILQQTGSAQGDFARTSTGLANAQRILRASFGDIRSELGGQVLPVVAALTSAFAHALPDALHAVRGLVAAFTIDAGAMGNVLDAVRRIFGDTVANAIQPFVHRFMEAIPAIRGFVQQVQQVGLALSQAFERLRSGELGAAWDDLLDLLRALGATLAPVLAEWTRAFLDWAGQVVPPLVEALKARLGDLWAWIRETAPPLLRTAVGEWIPAFITWVAEVVPPLYKELDKLVAQLSTWIRDTGVPQMVGFGHQLGDALILGMRQALGIRQGSDPVADWVRTVLGIKPGSDPLADVLGMRVENAAGPGLVSPETRLREGLGRVHVEIHGMDIVVGMDPRQAAREAGAAVEERVFDALTQSQAATDPAASTRLQGAGR